MSAVVDDYRPMTGRRGAAIVLEVPVRIDLVGRSTAAEIADAVERELGGGHQVRRLALCEPDGPMRTVGLAVDGFVQPPDGGTDVARAKVQRAFEAALDKLRARN